MKIKRAKKFNRRKKIESARENMKNKNQRDERQQ